MRKTMFWFGWTIFFLLPIAFVTEVLVFQDMPSLPLWKWVVPVVAFALIILGRNRDDVLKHHIV